MRNAFVVLVSLCIALVSGFIVPSSSPEFSSLKNSSIIKKSGDEQVKSTTTATSTTVTRKLVNFSQNTIDIYEKDLYEHATEKQNNQSERAFIYINQKYKKPIRNKIIKMMMDKPELPRTAVPPTIPWTSISQTPCPSTFDNRRITNSYFQAFDFSEKQPEESYFAAPNIFRCNFKDDKRNKENQKARVPPQTANRVDDRRDYFELLKPPILRPVSRVNNKVNQDTIHKSSAHSPSIGNAYKDAYKKYNLQNQYITNKKVGGERTDELRKKFGFEGPYIRRPVFRAKDFLSRLQDTNFEREFMNDEDTHRMYENIPEEDKLLDKYLKDTLEEQPSSNDKIHNNALDCSYRDCVLQSSKLYANNGLLIKPECKCGRRLNIKQLDPFLAKDRSLREEAKRNDTVPKSTEVNYYEEMLTDDTNLGSLGSLGNFGKLDDDVVKPPNKFNESAVH